jgi:hypothetical protein
VPLGMVCSRLKILCGHMLLLGGPKGIAWQVAQGGARIACHVQSRVVCTIFII